MGKIVCIRPLGGRTLQRLAVYCGSSPGNDTSFADATRALGSAMTARNIDLVYGGGKLGLMGIIADTILEGGGKAFGVIPETLVGIEAAHNGLSEQHIVTNMHERKAKMTDLTDAFVALPGGIGTLDELFEAWTWNALGYHAKPFALLNIGGYWDPLVELVEKIASEGFMSRTRQKQLIISDTIDDALDQLTEACKTATKGITL